MKKGIAELIGTFALVFFGTGAIVVDQVSCGAVTHIGVSITFGLVVLAMIYSLGDISGAHLNPAVSFGFAAANRIDFGEAIRYMLFQFSGAFLASLSLRLIFPQIQNLGVSIPSGSAMQSFVLETILTFFLMFVILNVSTGAKEKGITAGIAVASVVGLEALFAGPICGASMNPARSIAPAIFSGNLDWVYSQWIYLTAPFIGSLIAVGVFKYLTSNQINLNANE